jgi:hypothetical protein
MIRQREILQGLEALGHDPGPIVARSRNNRSRRQDALDVVEHISSRLVSEDFLPRVAALSLLEPGSRSAFFKA